MQGVIDLASELWWHRSLVIDLSELTYSQGDTIDYCFASPRRKPVAVVVGPSCEHGLAELWFGLGTSVPASHKEGVFDNLAAALEHLRRP
jgi:hypothetical protein